ncbi:MAG: FG-GAP-like repeat-containing protein [Phycisphaerales bacterium]
MGQHSASIGLLLAVASTAVAQGGFEDITGAVGLSGYRASMGDDHGPGGVFADLDNDGYPDLYLLRALVLAPPGTNQLFLNRPGSDGGRVFVEIPEAAGADNSGPATGAIAADYDNDGDLDLYVTNFDGPNVLYRNTLIETGTLGFVDATDESDPTPGVADDQHGVGTAFHDGVELDNSLTAAWADVDRDGWIDLYVGNHNGYYKAPGVFEGPFDVPGRRDVLYRNNGDGTFTDITMDAGVPGWEGPAGEQQTAFQRFSSSNAVIFADLDEDGWIDLWVTNKIGGPDDRDMLYRNRGADAGGQWLGFETATYALPGTFGAASPFAMGIDIADVDYDGDLVAYITDWSDPVEPTSPGLNDFWLGTMADSASFGFELAIDAAPSYVAPAKLSWGAQFQDFDNDGWQDLHVTTSFPFRDYLYMNTGAGFDERAIELGVDRDRREARGSMSADFDRDGWVDLFVVNIDGLASALFRNELAATSSDHGFATLRLVGDPEGPGVRRSSLDAIGATVELVADIDGDGVIGPRETQTKIVTSGSSNAASTSSLDLEFGLGLASTAQAFVRWPSGLESAHTIQRDSFVTIDEAVVCVADMDGDGRLTRFDFLAFGGHFDAGDGRADIDRDGRLTVFDFLLFQNLFDAGCG